MYNMVRSTYVKRFIHSGDNVVVLLLTIHAEKCIRMLSPLARHW